MASILLMYRCGISVSGGGMSNNVKNLWSPIHDGTEQWTARRERGVTSFIAMISSFVDEFRMMKSFCMFWWRNTAVVKLLGCYFGKQWNLERNLWDRYQCSHNKFTSCDKSEDAMI